MLLVEDDEELGELVTALLDEAGYRSTTVIRHDDIAEAIDRFDPRCVILDGEVTLTGRSRSWEDAAAIRRAHPALPVVMFTADADALAEERAGTSRRSREAGFAGVVPKPFAIDELLGTLQNAIERRSLVRVTEAAIVTDRNGPSASEPARSDFFTTALHRLESSLANIREQMQLAPTLIGKDAARGRLTMKVALRQLATVSRLVASLQSELHLKADVPDPRIVTFDLAETVADAISRHVDGETARYRLHRPGGDVRVRGTPDSVTQILDKLLRHALTYAPAGAPIDISIMTIGAQAQVRVEDYGIGAAAEERDRMVAAYYQAPPAAHQSGHRVWHDDNTDTGSVFALALPLAM